MNKNYIRGRNIEYKAKKELEAQGYTVIRASGSHGIFDLVAGNKDEVVWIQCKRAITKLSKPDLKAYCASIDAVELPENNLKELWVWEDRRGFRKFDAHGFEMEN